MFFNKRIPVIRLKRVKDYFLWYYSLSGSRAFSVLVSTKPGSKSLFGRVFEPDNRVHLS